MYLPEIFSLGSAFKQFFEVVPAHTDALKNVGYFIRHQVYCEELAFEPQRPDRREFDEYDGQSLHLLIRCVKTGGFVGTCRIVLAREYDPCFPLPFEKICRATLDCSMFDRAKLPRRSIAEISRLAVVAQFRKRKGEREKATLSISDQDFGTPDQPRFPYIPIGLYLGIVELARMNNIKMLFVLTEPRLANHFKKLGVNVQAIGSPVEHRGERIPSMLDTDETVRNLKALLRPLYHVIASEIAMHLPDKG
jgi:N-acyl amino acid synthase of PEP-CTERM/exosortase system